MNKYIKVLNPHNYLKNTETGIFSGVISRKIDGILKPVAIARKSLTEEKVTFYKVDIISTYASERMEKGIREPFYKYIESSNKTSVKKGDLFDRGNGVLKIP